MKRLRQIHTEADRQTDIDERQIHPDAGRQTDIEERQMRIDCRQTDGQTLKTQIHRDRQADIEETHTQTGIQDFEERYTEADRVTLKRDSYTSVEADTQTLKRHISETDRQTLKGHTQRQTVIEETHTQRQTLKRRIHRDRQADIKERQIYRDRQADIEERYTQRQTGRH